MLAQQAPALAFGHSAPDTPFDPVVQRLGEAFGPDLTAEADGPGTFLVGAVGEEVWLLRLVSGLTYFSC